MAFVQLLKGMTRKCEVVRKEKKACLIGQPRQHQAITLLDKAVTLEHFSHPTLLRLLFYRAIKYFRGMCVKQGKSCNQIVHVMVFIDPSSLQLMVAILMYPKANECVCKPGQALVASHSRRKLSWLQTRTWLG